MNPMMYEGTRLFVYGTLKWDGHLWKQYLEDQDYLGEAMVPGKGIMFHLGAYPGVNLREPLTAIHGEVYDLKDPSILHNIDIVEGHPDHFKRRQIFIPNHGMCWIYEYPMERCTNLKFIVPDGNWLTGETAHLTKKAEWRGWNKGFVPIVQSSYDKPVINRDHVYKSRPGNKENEFYLIDENTGEEHGPFELKGWHKRAKDGTQVPRISEEVSRQITKTLTKHPPEQTTLFLPRANKQLAPIETVIEANKVAVAANTKKEEEVDDSDPFYEVWISGPGATAVPDFGEKAIWRETKQA